MKICMIPKLNLGVGEMGFMFGVPVICISHPLGPGNSRAFNFSIFKALHCGAKFVVKSLLNAPPPGLTLMNNKLNKLSIFPLFHCRATRKGYLHLCPRMDFL